MDKPASSALENLGAFQHMKNKREQNTFPWMVRIVLLFLLILLFLPWNQHVQSTGKINARSPQDRPQAITSIIDGRVEKWYVQEGDEVKKGDTIAFLSEVKSDYFDPNLVLRTEEQLQAKTQSVASYDEKITAIEKQYSALRDGLKFKNNQIHNKIKQSQNKIKADSADLVALQNNLKITENQLLRYKELYNKGIKSLSELQDKELKQQELNSKVVSQENKLLNERNELANQLLELSAVDREYFDKMSKCQSEKQSAIAEKLNSIAHTSKLKNELSNYQTRSQYYYITSPQDGYITKTLKKGLGEIIKEGTDIATVVPKSNRLLVELFVEPHEVSLLQAGQTGTLRFDGWPTVNFGGWPEASIGVFQGQVVAVDPALDDKGKYRVLLIPVEGEKPWPKELKLGTGVQAFVLLNRVPLWYELWRQWNGFSPDYYEKKT